MSSHSGDTWSFERCLENLRLTSIAPHTGDSPHYRRGPIHETQGFPERHKKEIRSAGSFE